MSKQEERIAYHGDQLIIEFAVLPGGQMPARDFFYNDLAESEQNKILYLLKMLGDRRDIRNPQLFKKVKGTEFFEFKNFQIRIMCFMEAGGKVILTHGFKKKRDKTPPGEIERARNIKAIRLK